MTVKLRANGKDAVIVAADEVTLTFTLGGSATISGGTITTSIRPVGAANVVSDLAMTISDAAARIVTITLQEASTTLLSTNADPRILTEHIGDVKIVVGSVTTHSEPYSFWARRVVT